MIGIRGTRGSVACGATLALLAQILAAPGVSQASAWPSMVGFPDLSALGATGQPASSRGIVVEEVANESAAAQAGIQPGDVLLAWVRAATPASPTEAQGEITSPFDLMDLEIEQAPRGPVTIAGRRGSTPFSAAVPPGKWGVAARPQMAQTVLAKYLSGKAGVREKDPGKGIELWREAAAQAGKTDGALGPWLLLKLGDALADAQKWDEAHAAYRQAVEGAASGQIGLPHTLEAQGLAFERQNDFLQAEAVYRRALEQEERAPSETLSLAHALTNTGIALRQRGDLAGAETLHMRALAIREKLAPGSLEFASTLTGLAGIALQRGELDRADDLHRRSLAIREQLVPGGLEVAQTLNSRGNVAFQRRDLNAAEQFYRQAFTIVEKRQPGSRDVARLMNNVGMIAHVRGDLVGAEDFYKRALVVTELIDPGSLGVAALLINLGTLVYERGDLAAAADFLKQALAIRERVAPGSLEVAAALSNLGTLAGDEISWQAAEEFHQRSLAIQEKLAPGSLDVADTLNNLGITAENRGDLTAAETFFKKALALQASLAPDSLRVAPTLNNLGELAERRKDLPGAHRFYEQAHHILGRLAPGTANEAAALHNLARVARALGRDREAADFFQRAIDALETQTQRLGGSEDVRSAFAARHLEYYRNYVDLLAHRTEHARAFHVLERSRARLLLNMLAERDLVFAPDIPDELTRERRLIAIEYDRLQGEIGDLNPAADREKIERLLGRLRELRDKREALGQEIRKRSPRFAALQYPQPLDVAGTRAALDRGTVLLAYSVGKEKTFLFVVQPSDRPLKTAPAVSVFTLPVGEAALREQVKGFRDVIQRQASSGGAQSTPLLMEQGQRLFALLVGPAHAFVAAADRLLISPDGPLHSLPFAALVASSPKSSRVTKSRFLIELKPLHTVVSATVYAELRKARRASGTGAEPVLTAFGDPQYPAVVRSETPEQIASPQVRAMVRRGYDLAPLPASRSEVNAIAALYAGQATTYVGAEATEERAKAVGKSIRLLHFATHGLVDERFPLNSALALTIPGNPAQGQDNGLLQAWEIFEHLRIDADLVTLSACETALGKELGGEGLVGLTRAFQYAGARSVLATLWSVADESTGDLMTRFYRALKAGQPKDVALRAAQLELIRSGHFSHPFHWAAFTLTGDWR